MDKRPLTFNKVVVARRLLVVSIFLLFNGGLKHMPYLLKGRLFGPITCLSKTTIAFFLFIFFAVHGICWAAEQYMYDAHNRLTRVVDESVTMEFEYDGAGNRIAIRSDGSDSSTDRKRNPHHHTRHGKKKHHKPCRGRHPRSRAK